MYVLKSTWYVLQTHNSCASIFTKLWLRHNFFYEMKVDEIEMKHWNNVSLTAINSSPCLDRPPLWPHKRWSFKTGGLSLEVK